MTLKLLREKKMHRKIYKNPNMLYRYYFIIPLCINSRGGIFEKKKKAIRTRYSKVSSNQRIYFQITSEAITAVLRDIWDFRSNSGYPRERSGREKWGIDARCGAGAVRGSREQRVNNCDDSSITPRSYYSYIGTIKLIPAGPIWYNRLNSI